MEKDYEMITVKEYLDTLDEDRIARANVERYLVDLKIIKNISKQGVLLRA